MSRTIAAFYVVALMLTVSGPARASKEEDELSAGCDWLERAIAREPARDDAFGMFMRGMRPKCQAMLEGLARRDNSVKTDTVRQIVKEIDELRAVVDGEHGGPPPAVSGPTPGEQARQKVADEKAATEKVAKDKADAEREEKDRIAAEKAAREKAEAERIAAEKAAEEQRKSEEREGRRDAVADKKAEEAARKVAEREERERVAAEKKAAEEARRAAEREERERIAAEKKAAEETKRAAEREERERIAVEKKAAEEARKAAEREARERAEREREEARVKAQSLVEAETEAEKQASEDAARRAAEDAARRASEDAARRAAEDAARRAVEDAAKKKPVPAKGPKGGLDGTWEQPEARVLDRHVKRTLNLLTKDDKVQGELYEEVWFEAPSAWIDASCGGNKTFRMVTTARVSGEVEGQGLELWRDPPRILTCTCSSRCTVESRRRGMDLAIGASGTELRDATGVFVRPGTAVVVAPGANVPDTRTTLTPADFAGQWETSPFKKRDQTIVQRLELTVDGDGRVTGAFIERSSQGLPLASWSDRFCDGATKWEWVTRWVVEGKVSGRKLALKASDGAQLLCTCPSKCVAPKDKQALEIVYGATGATLHLGDQALQRR